MLKTLFSPLTADIWRGVTGGEIRSEEEKVAFTGDTLFKQSIGRTDFPGGSYAQMKESLKLLRSLPESTILLCGHGPQTSMADELRSNPYLIY